MRSRAAKGPKEIRPFDGTANGNQVSWKVSITDPMPMTLEFTGTVNGNAISGSVQLGAFGTSSFSGTAASDLPEQQTSVAIGIEPVAALDSMRVGAPHHLEAAEGAHEHEQGRARQVEIGQHRVDRAEAVARRDEQRGLAGKCRQPPSSAAALSSSRSEVEPTATMRPPACRVALSAAAVSALTTPHSGCMW